MSRATASARYLQKNEDFFMEIKVGDTVRFYPVAGRQIHSTHTVAEVIPNGIPSCREPMLKLEGKAGVVLAAHCKPVKSKTVYRHFYG